MGGYKGLQRVARGYRVLQGLKRVTGGKKGYIGLQGITKAKIVTRGFK